MSSFCKFLKHLCNIIATVSSTFAYIFYPQLNKYHADIANNNYIYMYLALRCYIGTAFQNRKGPSCIARDTPAKFEIMTARYQYYVVRYRARRLSQLRSRVEIAIMAKRDAVQTSFSNHSHLKQDSEIL